MREFDEIRESWQQTFTFIPTQVDIAKNRPQQTEKKEEKKKMSNGRRFERRLEKGFEKNNLRGEELCLRNQARVDE